DLAVKVTGKANVNIFCESVEDYLERYLKTELAAIFKYSNKALLYCTNVQQYIMKQLTTKQQQFYDSLVTFFRQHLRLPSHREAARLNDMKSANNSVHYHKALVDKGYLKKDGP